MRKQEIIKLIIDALTSMENVEYTFTGQITTLDQNLISLDFDLKANFTKGAFNVRGFIDEPLNLNAQFDLRSPLYDNKDLQNQIIKDLQSVSTLVNQRI
ncbi:hypothetical protein [Mucilaginibacter sp.]|uniref:hypothetical protein n=1 Tax=Mucilaginibacter sp. TaxID=1882438 RepID=UPI0026291019|nr:hypothetical protein [Mucilaginibacter sp.]MDB4925534.1 hypothetical protein [Mucilaginibacter sp.]